MPLLFLRPLPYFHLAKHSQMNRLLFLFSFGLAVLLVSCRRGHWPGYSKNVPPVAVASPIQGVNEAEIAEGKSVTVIVGATLVDGRGGEPSNTGRQYWRITMPGEKEDMKSGVRWTLPGKKLIRLFIS